MKRIAVLVSGGGTNLQALIDAKRAGKIAHGEIALVLSSNAKAHALVRAEKAGIPTRVVRRREYEGAEEYDLAIRDALREANIDIVVLAGYLSILGRAVLEAFPDRIVNVHPSLIPALCGGGFYGLRVHEEALRRGVKLTGATVHIVNEIVDGGRILLQKAVEVLPGDDAETLQRRVMEQAEWMLLPQAVEMLCMEEDGK